MVSPNTVHAVKKNVVQNLDMTEHGPKQNFAWKWRENLSDVRTMLRWAQPRGLPMA